MSSFIHEAILQEVPPTPDPVSSASQFNTYADFPVSGNINTIYLAKDTGSFYRWSGTEYIQVGDSTGAAATAQTNAENFASELVSDISPLFPLGSCYYADGGTGANPARYIVKNQSNNIIGYINLSWDGSPLILIGVQATDASGTPLVHGTFALYYDGSGNLTSAVCTN